MKLQAKCTNCGDLTPIFSWRMQGMDDDIPIPMNSTTISSIKDSPVLIISENVLDGKQSYNISAFVNLKGNVSVSIFAFDCETAEPLWPNPISPSLQTHVKNVVVSAARFRTCV